MSKKATKLTLIIVISFFLIGAIFLYIKNTQPSPPKNISIGILTYGSFPLMDMISDQAALILQQDPSISVKIMNANFQQEILRKSAKELARGKFDIILPISTPVSQMMIAENGGKKPIVFSFVSTPEALGINDPKFRKNVTGFTDTVPVEQIVQLIIKLHKSNFTIGFIVDDSQDAAITTYKKTEAFLKKFDDIAIKKISVSNSSEIKGAVASTIKNVDAFMIGPDMVTTGSVDLIAELAAMENKPVYCTDYLSVERGCVAAIAPDYNKLGEEVAKTALRIMNGEAPENIPIVNYENHITYINESMLNKLNLTYPKSEGEIIEYK